LRARWRKKARVIYQSVDAVTEESRGTNVQPRVFSTQQRFDVCVIGHLRPVKDPFRAAMAARQLPASSRIRVIHVGRAMTPQQQYRALAEMKKNTRYLWLGEKSSSSVRRILERSDLFVLSSRLEGGANALGEAIVSGVPVLASRIAGSIGILGDDYAGYFETGATAELAELMSRAETDPVFLGELKKACGRLIEHFDPAREEAAWLGLLDDLFDAK